MHLYIFGSLPRGEIGFGSDVDLLAITEKFDSRFDPDAFSIYSYRRICELWKEEKSFRLALSDRGQINFCV